MDILEQANCIEDDFTCNEYALITAYEQELNFNKTIMGILYEGYNALNEDATQLLTEEAGAQLKKAFKVSSQRLKAKTAQFFKTVITKLEDMDDSEFISKYENVSCTVSKNEIGEPFITDFETFMIEVGSIEDITYWYRSMANLIKQPKYNKAKYDNYQEDILRRLKYFFSNIENEKDKNYTINTRDALKELKTYNNYTKEIKSLYNTSARYIDAIMKTVQNTPDTDVSQIIALGNKIQSQIPVIDAQCIKYLNKRKMLLKKAIIAGYKKESEH